MSAAVNELLRAYRDKVQPRMCGLPMYNASLRVDAVGFQVHEDRPCGVLVTPWCMNLIVLAGAEDDWSGLASGQSVRVSFPAGDYDFTFSAPEGINTHLSLPLFTTVQEIADQDMASEIATEVLRRLYQTTGRKVQNDLVEAELNNIDSQRSLSRRDLLRGRLTAAGGSR
jgi:[NiFe] hydrogenase assembly HybE family chaperone